MMVAYSCHIHVVSRTSQHYSWDCMPRKYIIHIHSYCLYSAIFPDPTLTVKNATRVFEEVGEWDRFIPSSKWQEIRRHYSSERERRHVAGTYWVQTAPAASWEWLARLLYRLGERSALAAMREYLPTSRGMQAHLWSRIQDNQLRMIHSHCV